MVFLVSQNAGGPRGESLNYSEFEQRVTEQKVNSVVVQGQQIRGEYLDGKSFYSTGPDDQGSIASMLKETDVSYEFVPVQDDSIWLTALLTLLPMAVIVILFLWLMRNLQGTSGRAMNFGKSKAKLHDHQQKRYTFDDVACNIVKCLSLIHI